MNKVDLKKQLSLLLIVTFFISCSEVNDTDIIDDTNITREENIPPTHSIILPGAPGEESKRIDSETATNIASTSYVKADVNFLAGMIVHHEQAILMSNMADKRTNNKTIVDLANRIDSSQEDEINFMKNWLEFRDEETSFSHTNHEGHMAMAGMASADELYVT